MYLLIPGRHHLLTMYQYQYLTRLIRSRLQGALDLDGKPLPSKGGVEGIVFAVTSANHAGTRRNPLPYLHRALQIQNMGRELGVPVWVYGINDAGKRGDFAQLIVKTIRHESEGRLDLKPSNTIVVCATPVLELWEAGGYPIFGAELADRSYKKFHAPLPWELVETIAQGGWVQKPELVQAIYPPSADLWQLYALDSLVARIFSDPIVGGDGDLTETRDYGSYVRQMDEIAALKFAETQPYLQAGRVGDIGCAVGSWLRLAAAEPRLAESDFFGIELARPLYELCRQRKENNEFGTPNIWFGQKNAVIGRCFEAGSMDSIHTGSLTHEIFSYGDIGDLRAFIRNRFAELKPGGVWVNRDVVGPTHPRRKVWLEVRGIAKSSISDFVPLQDGGGSDLHSQLDAQNPLQRLLQFAFDFRSHNKDGIHVGKMLVLEANTVSRQRSTENSTLVELTEQDLAEFLLHKDYTDNWKSEMHERFAFWSFEDWQRELTRAGFELIPLSKAWTNPWIQQNRWEKDFSIWHDPQRRSRAPWPLTTMVMAARRPL